MQDSNTHEVAVIGGGLAGLTAAAYIARGGQRVTVYERASHVGGMAATEESHGFSFNFGPHAFYLGGVGQSVVDELGVAYPGTTPVADRALYRGRLHQLPTGVTSLLSTRLLSPGAKLETGRFLAGLPRMDTAPLDGVTLNHWLGATFKHARTRDLIRAVTRVSSYSNDPERASAGALLAQLQRALRGVRYVDGGWGTIVASLRERAEAAGARVVTGARVTGIERDGRVTGVRMADGEVRGARAVVVAASPRAAFDLVDGAEATPVAEWVSEAEPVRAACLDVALTRLPTSRPFALGIDAATYLSVHSLAAKLAPSGMALVSTMKYLLPGEHDAQAVEAELEQVLNTVHPGWRELVSERRYLPSLIVSHWSPLASLGGLERRPGPAVPGVDGLFVAGDWVGQEGMLSEAAFASARRAAGLALAAATRPGLVPAQAGA
jgi:phytoene dehydrogenase-like protein